MFHHVTVLQHEAVEALNVQEDGIYVDATLGGGGHSELIAQRLGSEGRLFAFDQDEEALQATQERLQKYADRITYIHANFRRLQEELATFGVNKIDGILFDLGVSSPQLDDAERGFSYQKDAPLDMRMDRTQPLSAKGLVNTWPEQELASIIWRYGEERFSKRIAHAICQARAEAPIETTLQLAELVKNAIPAATRRTGGHPAKRTFQAIRIAVNDELGAFTEAVQAGVQLLNLHGRIAVITFHSLEDRICKEIYQEAAKGCECPPAFPVCVCGRQPSVKIITRKPILPTDEEVATNRRAHSAKLRVAEKILE
ncbi:16S rRNA (cytosine(1402)-N(4))-methyltransferase RsmH [Rubeoparvulum massiliense]|uniref:16S rRNA (cytosine(1402)-N(4))-methyltransferase RsmH n=1 Tax=Rubeoparvulum massiliense TaxID=1631346 RepID=UPI00065E672C|nr:16S rRNA (cytosine(1402)-N(4))-methyltransferase RsmH [Rubeoparvulum massiliense]